MNQMFTRLKENARKRATYWRTVREIQSMPQDVADDLGIAPLDAHRIARQVVYG